VCLIEERAERQRRTPRGRTHTSTKISLCEQRGCTATHKRVSSSSCHAACACTHCSCAHANDARSHSVGHCDEIPVLFQTAPRRRPLCFFPKAATGCTMRARKMPLAPVHTMGSNCKKWSANAEFQLAPEIQSGTLRLLSRSLTHPCVNTCSAQPKWGIFE
jgi:hypothetical protein